jgi:hypothetical protein
VLILNNWYVLGSIFCVTAAIRKNLNFTCKLRDILWILFEIFAILLKNANYSLICTFFARFLLCLDMSNAWFLLWYLAVIFDCVLLLNP